MSESVIPIQNIYYLLCYAWNKLEEGKVVDVHSLNSTRLVDLFAKVLLGGTRHLIQRGFDRGYLPFSEETGRIRGKISFASSLKKNLLVHGRAHCEFDELDYNVLHNRILKTTIAHLILADGLDIQLKEGLGELLRRLRIVEPVIISSQVFRRVQLHKNNSYYSFLLNVCELIYNYLLVDERTGRSKFRDFLQDDASMARLFEAFVRNFYLLEQNTYRVRSMKINWQADALDEESKRYLPEMRTDICLFNEDRKIILECKYYRNALQNNAGKFSLHSPHLYQLFAYLKNKEIELGWRECEGIILYPAVDRHLELSYRIQGHQVRIKTINLNQDWQSIDIDLRGILGV
jgi:5-methylcytosine-specific restriction enzyme subunit McrC